MRTRVAPEIVVIVGQWIIKQRVPRTLARSTIATNLAVIIDEQRLVLVYFGILSVGRE